MGGSARVKSQDLWYCCKCHAGLYSVALCLACLEYNHISCKTCTYRNIRAASSDVPGFFESDSLQSLSKQRVDLVDDLRRRPSPFTRHEVLLDLPVVIHGETEDVLFDAIPDSGAQLNAISVRALKSLRITVESRWGSEDDLVTYGNKEYGDAICQVELSWWFPSERERPRSSKFHVFENLSTGVSIVIGRPLLEVTETLTKFSQRLRLRKCSPQVPRCMSIGPLKRSDQGFKVYLNSILIVALADTGSEIDLMSEACVDEYGFQMQCLERSDRDIVEFGNGKKSRVHGKVNVKFDTFQEAAGNGRIPDPKTASTVGGRHAESGSEIELMGQSNHVRLVDTAEEHYRTFYVLQECPYRVIVGQALLHSIDAFVRHQSAFTGLHPEGVKRSICLAFWWKGKVYETMSTMTQCKQREAARMAKYKIECAKLNRALNGHISEEKRTEILQLLDKHKDEHQAAKSKYNAEVSALEKAAKDPKS